LKTIVCFLLVLLGASPVFADFQSDFSKKLSAKDFAGAVAALKSWQLAEPDSPEVIVGFVNYFFIKSMSYGYSIDDFSRNGTDQEGKKLSFHDPKTGKDFYFNNKVFYNGDDIVQAMKYFDDGIKRFPNRLDIRFGKIHVANQVEDFMAASAEVVDALRVSRINGNQWLWSNDRPYGKSESDFLGDLQNYYNLWYQSASEAGLESIRVASEEQILQYPKHSWAYDNLALYYSYKKDAPNQIRLLLKSVDVDPSDAITLNNVANFYRLHGEKQKAIEYYNLVLKTTDKQQIEQAKKMLETLRK